MEFRVGAPVGGRAEARGGSVKTAKGMAKSPQILRANISEWGRHLGRLGGRQVVSALFTRMVSSMPAGTYEPKGPNFRYLCTGCLQATPLDCYACDAVCEVLRLLAAGGMLKTL